MMNDQKTNNGNGVASKEKSRGDPEKLKVK